MDSRLQTVKSYLELPFDRETELKDLVFLAAQICGTPIASITLVDDKKQYPVVGVGEVVESSADISFCNYTVKEKNVVEVPDALKDPRFTNNPLVTGAPYIRFYTGFPLTTSDGDTIGSLCVIDQQPKKLTENQLKSLDILSKQMMHRLELSKYMHLLKESIIQADHDKELFEQVEVIKNGFYDNSNDYFILINPKLEIVSFNRPAQEFFLKRNDGLPLTAGDSILNYILPQNIPNITRMLNLVKDGVSNTLEVLTNPGSANSFWSKFTAFPMLNVNKELIGIACIGCSIDTEKQQQQKISLQSNTLSKIAQVHSHEIRHPLANILGIIDIIKQDNFVMSEQFLGFLESASQELDQVIRNIVLKSSQAV